MSFFTASAEMVVRMIPPLFLEARPTRLRTRHAPQLFHGGGAGGRDGPVGELDFLQGDVFILLSKEGVLPASFPVWGERAAGRRDPGTYVLCSWICFSRRVFLRVATSRWTLMPTSSSRYRSVSFATISSTIASNRSSTARLISTVLNSSDAVHAPIFPSV